MLRLYNTLTRSVEPFEPIVANHVRIYVCGLTPSAQAHLGHARSFMFFDVLRRHLVHSGLRVTYVQNVTDIDDRSIATARETGTSWRDVIAQHYGEFKASMRKLHVLEPDHEPYATAYIPEIVAMIEMLVQRGYAYVAGDGVYYSVTSFPRYGRLSHRNIDELLIGARIEPGEQKADPLDFALWKFAKPGEPDWPSPWGAGRPGWHIECSAMSHALLGEPFDIHGGGFDLVFPHHENEIAQSEPLMERPPMAKVWLHGGLLSFDGRKMSKSLGNFEPLSAVLERYDPQAIRLLFLQTGYRKPMNFTEASIGASTIALTRLYDAYDALRHGRGDAVPEAMLALQGRVKAALDDDMNTAGTVGVLFDVVKDAGALADAGAAQAAAALLHGTMETLGISPNERTLKVKPVVAEVTTRLAPLDDAASAFTIRGQDLPDSAFPADFVARLEQLVAGAVALDGASPRVAIEQVIDARRKAKLNKNFALSDQLRDALSAVEVTVADVKGGAEWSVGG